MPISGENYADIRNGSASAFDDIAAVSTGRQVLPREDGTSEQVKVGQVTPNFFRLMGATIALGRDFNESDGAPQPVPPGNPQVNGAAPVGPTLPTMVMLSYDYWRRRFGGDPNIVGRDLPAGPNGPRLQRIVGVLPPGFQLLFPPADNMETAPDVWTALRLRYNNANRNGYFLRLIGRLKAGVSLARAQDAVESAAADIRKIFRCTRPLVSTRGSNRCRRRS